MAVNENQTNLRDSKVDQITTKNIDMKQRRVVNAAPAQDSGDYITLTQLQDLSDEVGASVAVALAGLFNSFKTSWTTILKLVVNLIKPQKDSFNAIQVVKADGKTVVANFDTLNGRFGVAGSIFSTKGDAGLLPAPAQFLRMQYDPLHVSGYYGDIVAYDPVGSLYMPLSIRASKVTLGSTGGQIAFFTDNPAAPVFQQVLVAYTSNNQGTVYVATPASLAQAATLVDLNNLRAAYENLRTMCDDLRAKLRTSTLVG